MFIINNVNQIIELSTKESLPEWFDNQLFYDKNYVKNKHAFSKVTEDISIYNSLNFLDKNIIYLIFNTSTKTL